MGLIDRVRSMLTRRVPETKDYRPWPGSSWMRHVGKRPQLTLWQIDQMEHDPKLRLATAVADAPLLDLEIEVDCPNDKIAAYVKDTFEKLWAAGARKLLRARRYGYMGFEVMYRNDHERISFHSFRDLHPRDVRPLTRDGLLVGMMVKNLGVRLMGPKALWLVHDQRWGYWFGRSEYENSWPAYWEKWMNDGAIDKRILRMMKDAWVGDVLYYDPTYTMTLPDGTQITGRDLAREAGENRTSGGMMALPTTTNATTNAKVLEYQPPTSVDGATKIFEYMSVLDGEITEGQGVPAEILDAAEAGGYSGRSIPMVAWLKSADVDAAEFLAQIDDQILWPLVKLNFDTDRCYTVKHRPVIETFTKNLGGGEEGRGEAGGGSNGKANGFSPFRSNAGQMRFGGGPLQMSDTAHAPVGGVTIQGKKFAGGEFIPGEVMEKATAKEKAAVSGESTQRRSVTKTPEFKKWFGDSKVVDEEGAPLVVFHGTRGGFSDGSFKKRVDGAAIFFTANSDVASAYSIRYGSHSDPEKESARAARYEKITEKYIKDTPPRPGEKPWMTKNRARNAALTAASQSEEWKNQQMADRVEDSSVVPVYLSIKNPYVLDGELQAEEINATKDDPAAIARLRSRGYDGILVRNASDRPTASYSKEDQDLSAERADLWVVFDLNQIKSATGNKGSFDPQSDDVRLADELDEPLIPSFGPRLDALLKKKRLS